MDFPKRERALPQGSPRRSPVEMRSGAATEADENASPKRTVPAWAASPQRKKVLGERNDGGGGAAGMDAAASPPPPQPKSAPSPPTLTGRGAGAYGKTNYTTPRPEFLRYDPERRREILLRVARAAEVEDDDCSSTSSGSAASEDDGGSVASDAAAAASPVSPARRSDSEAELGDSDEEEEEEEEEEDPASRGRSARRLFLLLVAVACSFCYMCCMNPAAFPVHHSEDGLDFIGRIGGMYDAGDHEVDSLRLLGTVYMMGPEDVLEEGTSHNWDSEGMIRPYDQSASPRNLVAVTMMGLTDICLNVQLGELTCPIGGESSEKGVYLKEDSGVDEHETEVPIESIPLDSNSTQTTDMEDGSLGLVYQEDGEDHSNRFVQLGSMEKAMESASDKLDDRMCLENEELNLDTKLWQYENTAEAAKAICSTVKFLWFAMETHLLQILACSSVVGFVAAMFKYFQRSRKMAAPASRHVSSESLAEVPVLVPHQIVQVPVSPSPQAMQLPVYSSEQPTQLTGPKQGRSGSLEVPMELAFPKPVSLKDPLQKPLPKTDPFVNLKVPAPVRGNCDQKLQQGDANNMEPSNGNFDSSKPPMVELIGEFTFANSSRRTPIKRMKQYAGDAEVQENSVKGEKMDATPAPLTPTPLTPTPLRRSSRLRNKVTSP